MATLWAKVRNRIKRISAKARMGSFLSVLPRCPWICLTQVTSLGDLQRFSPGPERGRGSLEVGADKLGMLFFYFYFFLLEWACQGRNSHWYVTENVNGNLSWPEGLLGLEMVERLVEHLAKVIFHSVTGMQDGFFQSPNQDFEIVSYLLLPVSSCVRTRLAFGLDKCLCCGSCWPCEKWYLLCYEKTTQYYSTNPHSTEWETGMPVWLWPYM